MSPLLVIILISLIGYLIHTFIFGKPINTPPGIPRLPLTGSYWFLLWKNYHNPYKAVTHYMKKLKSKIISCYIGDVFTVVVNDYDTIKEVFVREEFDGRVTNGFSALARAFDQELGIFFTDGAFWREQRRFALRHMRDFGFGRRQEKLESHIMEEISLLMEMLKFGPMDSSEQEILSKDGRALFPDILYPVSANSIWLVMTGQALDRSEFKELTHICRSAMMFQRSTDSFGGVVSQLPWLKHFGNVFGYRNMIKGNYNIVDFVTKHLDMQSATHNSDVDRGFIDKYWSQMNENGNSTFTKKQLIMTVVDFMFPALSATPAVITHCIKYMIHYPNIAEKVRKEIDKVVGTGRLVCWEDRKKLPYTEATIREVLRVETLVPLGVGHKCVKETSLFDYTIPKNTFVLTNLEAMNEDRELWGDPENFRPERFLNNDELSKDLSFNFGLGHRVCAGETFARYTVFGTFAALMQNYNFIPVEGEPLGLEDKEYGFIITPKEAWIRLKTRQ